MIEVFNLSALVLRNCIKRLFQAFILILFFGSTFILLGKQLYKGVLTQKCVILPPVNITDAEYAAFIINSTNWLESKNGYYLCGNNTGSRPCPENYTCLKGANVNTYISNFNFYGSSVVTISQLMTLHFWQELYQKMLLTAGTLHVSYFVLAFYSFLYSSGLILSIITRSYKNVLKEFEVVEKKNRLVKRENIYSIDTQSQKGIVKSPSCKSYELFSSQILSSERIERQTSEIIESTSRATDQSFESDGGLKEHLAESRQKREAVRSQLANDKSGEFTEQTGALCYSYAVRQLLKTFVLNFATELFFLTAIASHLCIVIVQYSHLYLIPLEIAVYCYYLFAGITLLEVMLKIIAFTPAEFFQSKWNSFDCVVLIIGGSELLLDVEHPVLLTLRTYKLVKLLICCNTFVYMKNALGSCLFLFKHPLSILLVFIIICIVTGMQLYGYEYFHSSDRFPDQIPPRWYFKDFYSSFILVFCMLCGDWKQPMVNTVLFTSYASDLLMLIFVLIGNFVIINLFLGIVFYTFFYKSLPRNAASKDRLQNAIQIILNRQGNVSDTVATTCNSKSDRAQSSNSSASDAVSETQDNASKPFRKNKMKQLHNQCEMEIMEDSSSEYMPDCCPSLCYFCCSFCKADENPVLWQNWADVRCRLYWFVETKFFRVTVSLIIIFSVTILILEQSHGPRYPDILYVLKILNPIIFMLFFFETVLKWMAYGLQKFFKSHLGRFEFFILVIFLIDLLSIKFFDGQKNIFKALRAFRLLSFTSLLESYQETVPLPMKRNNCVVGSDSASNESLLHLRQMECNHFLGRHCRYHSTGSGEILQMEWNTPEIHSSDLSDSRMRRIELNRTADYRERNPTMEASDCLPKCCHDIFPLCKQECGFFKLFSQVRGKSLRLITSSYFFSFVVVMILISCCQLAIELNISSEKLPIIVKITAYADRVFAMLFLLEMLLKMFALGFKGYYTNIWCIVEFITTATTIAYAVFYERGVHLFGLKMIRVSRLLYLSKTLQFNKQSQAILTSLGNALPSHFLVFWFVFYLWLVFAILGSAMFSEKLHHCFDTNNQELAYNETVCKLMKGSWKKSPVNFDSVTNAFIGLLQVATLQNWISFVTDIMDNSNAANEVKNQVYTATFFPLFIMFSTFLTLNLFVGVTCWYFNDLKRDSENTLNSRTRWLYKSAIKKMENIRLQKTIPAPKLHLPAFFYRMVNSDNFEMAGFLFIGLHMLLIALDMYDPDPSEMFALAMTELNVFFIVIFLVEIILKLIAYRQYYFMSLWNHFDVIVLVLCICGVLFEDLFSSPMLPAMLRLIRFIKCRRYLRRYIRGMLPLLYTLYSSIPAFITIVILQFIVMFIYSVFGVHQFHNVKQSWDISGELSFETFPKAMLLLFQLSTLAGWIDVLHCISESGENLNSAILFVVSYIIIVYYVIIKTHVVVILDSYDTAMCEYENILLKEDYEMFAEVWQKFDNNARGIIKFGHLQDLLDVLEEPLHCGRPNRYLIATLNIPIYEGDLVFYADVMDALTRDYMCHNAHLVEVADSIPGLLDNKGKTLKKISSSLWRQRQNHCAYVIQRAWRQYTGHLAKSPVFYSEVRLADQGDKVDTVLTAEVQAGSHVSV